MQNHRGLQRWDDTMKRLISAHPQHFAAWIVKGARFRDFMSIELRNKTLKADVILDVDLDGEEILLHVEFQSSDDVSMPQRLLEYNVGATREHNRLVISCVLYLRENKDIAESPLEWKLTSGRSILSFHFVVIKLWAMLADEIMQTGFVGLLPLLPLTKDGKQRQVVDKMIDGIIMAKQFDLLPLGEIFAGLVFKEGVDREWLQRRFAVYRDIAEDSWVYQEILQKGVEKGIEQGIEQGIEKERQKALQGQRDMFLTIVRSRFPQMAEFAQKHVGQIMEIEVLQGLIVKASLAQVPQEVFDALKQASAGKE